jgi:hypothetical protein
MRFERAVRTGNPHLVIAAAHELPRPVLLRDALRVLLVLAVADADRYPPLAVEQVLRRSSLALLLMLRSGSLWLAAASATEQKRGMHSMSFLSKQGVAQGRATLGSGLGRSHNLVDVAASQVANCMGRPHRREGLARGA